MPCLSKTLRHHYAFSRLQIRPRSHPGRAGLPAGLLSRKSGHPRLSLPPALCHSWLIVDAEDLVGQLRHLLGVLVEQGVVLHDEEAVVVLLQNGHELEEGVGPAYIQLGYVAIQPAEDARVVAADEEDLGALQFRVAVDGLGHNLHRGVGGVLAI